MYVCTYVRYVILFNISSIKQHGTTIYNISSYHFSIHVRRLYKNRLNLMGSRRLSVYTSRAPSTNQPSKGRDCEHRCNTVLLYVVRVWDWGKRGEEYRERETGGRRERPISSKAKEQRPIDINNPDLVNIQC